ncbi:MAG: hypothetical protein F9K46_00760 [Anaerolineae bacterium]|nr:MAG: hypothetical protein F9K46_00760 [Anaerolineae bacterium]
MKIYGVLLPIMLLMGATLACDLSEVEDTVNAVSKAVTLLEEISESGTWKYTTEGLEALDKTNGFAAEATMTSGDTTATGESITQINRQVFWSISADAQGDSILRITQGDTVREYLTVDKKRYLINADGTYSCDDTTNEDEIFAGNVGDLFVQYSATAIGVQAISVAEQENTNVSMNGFTTTQYHLVSKLQDALDILKDVDSEDLKKEIADVPPFYIDGAIYIDNATKALIRFEATYSDLERQEGNTFIFNVTALGNQPDYTAPDPAKIVKQCGS